MPASKKKQTRATTQTRDEIFFFLNGELTRVPATDGLMTFAEWARKRVGKTGTKIVCAEGDCGACTILRMSPYRSGKDQEFLAVNSCILAVGQLDGSHLATIEGIALNGELSPTQKQMRDCHGSQCGFCTPGFVMAISGALETKKNLSAKQAVNCTTGNLCRCTGYAPIIQAATTARQDPAFLMRKRYLTPENIGTLARTTASDLLFTTSDGTVFYAPKSLPDATAFLTRYKSSKIISGGTDLGVRHNKGQELPPALLSLHAIRDLHHIKAGPKSLSVGSMATLDDVRLAARKSLPELSHLLNVFASPQIKHCATLAGNIANASPIGDTMPFLLAADAVLEIASGQSKARRMPLSDFYKGYKQIALKSGELISGIEIPLNDISKNIRFFKVAQRKDLDISTVSMALSVTQTKSRTKAGPTSRVALGGVAATPIRVPALETFIDQNPMSRATIGKAVEILQGAIKPLSDLRGSSDYRRVVLGNLLTSYFEDLADGGGKV